MASLDLIDSGLKNSKDCSFILVVTNFSKFCWTFLIWNKAANVFEKRFENIFESSGRKPSLFDTDDAREFVNKIFTDFLKRIKLEDRITIHRKNQFLLKDSIALLEIVLRKLVFENSNADWMDEINPVTKQCIITKKQRSTKLTPFQASLTENEGYAYQKFLDKTKNITPQLKLGDLVKTANKTDILSKGERTSWSHKLYTVTKFKDDAIPTYDINSSPERDHEFLVWKKTVLAKVKQKKLWKIQSYIKSKRLCPSLPIDFPFFPETGDRSTYLPASISAVHLFFTLNVCSL